MNGLRYVRRLCNISMQDLANEIGVTRQAISQWERGSKPTPAERKRELSFFFGLPESYFGEIDDRQKEDLLDKQWFRYYRGDKEYFSFRGKEDPMFRMTPRTYMHRTGDDLTMDERYAAAVKKKEDVMQRIEDAMNYYGRSKLIADRITAVNRGCQLFGSLADLMEHMPDKKVGCRMSYYYEIADVLYALMLANDLISVDDIKAYHERNMHTGTIYDGTEFAAKLADMIRQHQETVSSASSC